jgi:hypothetical protein
MAGTRPRSEKQEKTGVCEGFDLVALCGREVHQAPDVSLGGFTGIAGDAHLSLNDSDPGALVNLMVCEYLARGKVKRNGASLLTRRQDLRTVRSEIAAFEIPDVHPTGQCCSSANGCPQASRTPQRVVSDWPGSSRMSPSPF